MYSSGQIIDVHEFCPPYKEPCKVGWENGAFLKSSQSCNSNEFETKKAFLVYVFSYVLFLIAEGLAGIGQKVP